MSAARYALIEFSLGRACEERGCDHREVAVRRGESWLGTDSGLYVADSVVTKESPLHLVSLDAAIEAAAKAICEQAAKASDYAPGWEACADKEMHRRTVRPVITAAVVGGAQ